MANAIRTAIIRLRQSVASQVARETSRAKKVSHATSQKQNTAKEREGGSKVFWYTEVTRRLAEEHEATKAERQRLGDWYQEIKARREAAPDDRAKAAHQETLRFIGRPIRSAEQRRNAACEARYQSSKADHAAYERRREKP